MDIKSILGSVSSKKGPDTDVKNRCSVGFSCEEEPSKGRDDFAKLLAEEDSKTSTLLVDTAALALAAGELPQLLFYSHQMSRCPRQLRRWLSQKPCRSLCLWPSPKPNRSLCPQSS
jgi:hypothetical protein